MAFAPQYSSYPTLSASSQISNISYDHCIFNFTDRDDKVVAMYQNIDISTFSVFTDTGELNYTFSLNVCCENSSLDITGSFFDAALNRISNISEFSLFSSLVHLLTTDECTWEVQTYFGRVPILGRSILLQVAQELKEACFINNIQLYVRRNK